MKLPMQKSRGPSLTVIGAISETRGLVHHSCFAASNTSDTFFNFLNDLKKKCPQRTVVVLDNLKIHHSKKLEAIYAPDFKEMLLPPYSSELNPIERLWSVLKRKWTAGQSVFAEEVNANGQNKDVIQHSIGRLNSLLGKLTFLNSNLESIEERVVKGLARSHYRSMLAVLQG